jgi:GNAT superfamily N-acetyltransferase
MKTMPQAPSGYAIRAVDLHDADDALLDRVVAFAHLMDREAVPEDPPMPAAAIKARLRERSKFGERVDRLAFRGDELVGRVGVWQNKSGSNEHIRDLWVQVHPAHRRLGLGTALLAAGLETIPTDGSTTSLTGWTSTRVPAGGAFAEHLGAKRGLHMRVSQVDLRTIDRALMREWASVDPKGYRLELIENDVPDHLMAAALNAFNAINRMPLEGLEMEPWKFTEETQRDWERQRKARGQEHRLMLALEEATGEGVAFTGINFDPRVPSVIHQGGTAVDPKHQGRDLGKWLKGRMVEKILAEIPEARFIRTDNAGTNAPMLAINDRMGFVEAWWGDVWQIPLDDARKYVGL